MTLTHEQRKAIDDGETVAVIIDGTPCVLVRSDVFERVCRDAGDWSHAEMRAALARSSKENGWDDPGMDAYDQLVP